MGSGTQHTTFTGPGKKKIKILPSGLFLRTRGTVEIRSSWAEQAYLVVPSKRGGGSETEVRGDGSTSLTKLHRQRKFPLRNSVPNLNCRATVETGSHLAGAAAAMATIREGFCAAMR